MPDVLVAGGGPTGLLAVFELERAGLAYVAAAIEARLRTPVLRGAAVTAVEQDGESVTVTAGGRRYRAGWLVAADGGHSTGSSTSEPATPVGPQPEISSAARSAMA